MALNRERLLLAVVVIITIAFFAYWSAFTINRYNLLITGYDDGAVAYSTYYYLHYPVSNPLQYLVYGQHTQPDSIIFLLFVYILPNTLTILLFQDLYVALAGIMIFVGTKDLLKNQSRAFLVFILYMFNPGTLSFFIGAYHPESAIVPLAFLVFYFYMKKNFTPFIISMFAFIFVFEITPILLFFLAAGLFVYEFYGQNNKKLSSIGYRYIKIMAVVAIIGTIFYLGFGYYMQAQYGLNTNNIPPTLVVYPFISSQLSFVGSLNTSQTSTLATGSVSTLDKALGVASELYGIIVVVLSYGISMFSALPSYIIFILPWAAGAFFTKGQAFFGVNEQYLSFALYGTIISSILGYKLSDQKKGLFPKRRNTRLDNAFSLLIVSLIIVVYPAFLILNNSMLALNSNIFFLSQTPAQQAYSTQISSMIALVPENTTFMTSDFMLPRLISYRYWEPFELANSSASSYDYFIPKYILLDQKNVDYNTTENLTQLESMISAKYNCTNLNGTKPGCDYYVLAQNGTAVLFEARN